MIRSTFMIAAASVALSGCALLSSPDPVQLYRFGGASAYAGTGATSACPDVHVAMRRVDFPEAARGDRLLAVTGAEAAYIKGARWVSPAETLFEEALRNAFLDGGTCTVLSSGPLSRDGLMLSVDVRRFEAAYAAPGAVPDANIVVLLRLFRMSDRSLVVEDRITVRESAGENRQSAIVAAFDRATAEASRQIVLWTDQQGFQATRD
ncbi:ABC-type transport auxiliary lipoprotein family protein [Brevundimonas sp.]|uniref:ABC-type transport auxiliary lipoprotein family protein n=1 Tax=Brevundimonas sp. TaxID=1871086 RepID=UPI0028AEE37A|nr:ABC-type transport auxiliary lipoprotein family protein [Brevundimonas sp.]